jgi:hypothetical protein
MIQAFIRKFLAFKKFKKILKSKTVIINSYKNYRKRQLKKNVILIQKYYRGW